MHRTFRLLLLTLIAPMSATAQFAVDPSVGIWVNASELAQLPMSGDAWDDLYSAATDSCLVPDLTHPDDEVDECVLAKAIGHLRLHAADPQDPQAAALRADVVVTLGQMMDEANWCENGLCPPCDVLGVGAGDCMRRSLAVGRNLGAYLVAAELIGLDTADTPSREELIAFLEGTGDPTDPEEIEIGILDYQWIDAGTTANPTTRRSLRDTHDQRPNNWGGHACASTAAAAIFRGNSAELLQIQDVERGWLGDCTLGDCSKFNFGSTAAAWTCDQRPAVHAINRAINCPVNVSPGAGVDFMDVSGVQVDDMRRGGIFPAGCDASPRACVADVHIWDGLQGRVACAYMLRRQGLDLFSASTSALRRAYDFQHQPVWEIDGVAGQPHPPHISKNGNPNDDAFLAYIVNHIYGTSYPLDPAPGGPGYYDFGKGLGWTRYTLGEHPCGWLAFDPDFDGVCDAVSLPATPDWALAAGGLMLAFGAGGLLARFRPAAR